MDLYEQVKTGGLKVYGNADEKVSPYLKVWIAQPDKENKINSVVCGLIGQGTSRALQANWTSPFEQSNLGSTFEKLSGVAQEMSGGRTSITTLSSTQIWEGNRPHTFTLNVGFYALKNALAEVMQPLKELEMMMGPNIKAGLQDNPNAIQKVISMAESAIPAGRIPLPVILNIGRRMMIPNCVIESMSVPLDKERTKEGYLVRAEVSLTICTKAMLNKEGIADTWP